MPDIKHNFTSGKMNKDLDERLIPNGQYRDEMNIQVSTSEGSDVGTAQNILGNSIVPGQSFISSDAVCVGSISDEKNDKLYWFVINYDNTEYIKNGGFDGDTDDWTTTHSGGLPIANDTVLPGNGWAYGTNNVTATDVQKFHALTQRDVSIIKGKTYIVSVDISSYSGTGNLSPVLVDQYGAWTRPSIPANFDNNSEPWVWTLRVGEVFTGQQTSYGTANQTPYPPNFIYFQNRADTSGGSNKLNCTIDNISITGVNSSCIVQYDTKTNTVTPVFVDVNNTVLKLDPSKLITGVNIIDDNSEPKKINIPRSIQGTNSKGYTNTYLINSKQNLDLSSAVTIKEEHTTVIRKSPKHPPTIQYETFRDTNLDYTGIIKISDNVDHPNSFINSSIGRMHDFSFIDVGDTFNTIIETDINNSNTFSLEWKPGDKVAIKEFDFDNVSPTIPITNYRIKGTITDWQGNRFTNTNYLLTLNGDLSEGSGPDPDSWTLENSTWTWNQSLGTLECDGTSASEFRKIYNHNDNKSGGPPPAKIWGDIVEGGRYKIKYTISSPTNGEMAGRCVARLFGSDATGTTGDGYYWNLGVHTSPGEFEHEIVFDHIAHAGNPTPGGRGEWTHAANGAFLNSILFESKKTVGSTLGPQLFDADEWETGTGSITAGTLAGPGLANSITGQTIIWNTWAIINNSQVVFHHQHIDDATLAGGTNTVYLNNLMKEPLVDGEDYTVTLTVSNMTSTGGGNQKLGVSSNGGVGGDVRISTLAGDAHYGAIASGNDPWNGFGGQITHTFCATGNGYDKIDLFAWRDGGISSTNGPSGDITVSLKKVENPAFKGIVSNVSVEELDETVARVEIKVDSIDGTPPNVEENEISLNYAIDLLDEEEKLFEFKFPRFAYRYKYEDGEYSTISPFSEIAFVPGSFDYHPKKGYNLGMTNSIKSLIIKDYCRELPQDVSGIDILYKEEHSPNIYIVDDIKDIQDRGSSYLIEHETIKNGVTPSNQLLRPWDNVPKKALGQEIVGNRIVYGNYLQNYDLVSNITSKNYDINLWVNSISKENKSRVGKKSIKSLRDYQVGVVFSDEYGRETPIMTSNKATIAINKGDSSVVNQLEVRITNEGHPVNMKFFKFFIKDIGGEYYNLAMDRFYDAEDDNIWLAFPSTDRNKIDIDDFLILKKGAGSVIKDPKTGKLNNVIQEKAQYKVLDIKNEAPDFIKRKETRIAHVRHLSANKLFKDGDLPVKDDTNFTIEYNKIASSSYAKLHEDFGKNPDVEYHVSLSNTDTNRVSDRYKIIELHGDDNGITPIWYFTLEKPFSSEVNEFSNDPTGANTTAISDNTYLNIYRTAIDKSASHKFDGRFFVKIYNDDIFARALKDKVDDTKKEYKTTGSSRKIYSLETYANTNRIKKHFNGTDTTLAFYNIQSDVSGTGLNDGVSNKPSNNKHTWQFYSQATQSFVENVGTLNRKKILDEVHDNSVGVLYRDPYVWRDYDAYFRGINVYLGDDAIKDRVIKLDTHEANASDQKFEDVWFIDKAVNAGNFHYSTVSGKDVGWDTFPSAHGDGSWNSLGLRSWGEPSPEGSAEIELAFGGVQPTEWPPATNEHGDGWVRDESFFDLAGENYNYSEKEGDFIKNIAIGSQFRFKEDPDRTVYTITDVNTYLRIRYESLRHGYFGGYFDSDKDAEEGQAIAPNQIYPFHAKARAGKPSGLYDDTRDLSSNVIGNPVVEGHENAILTEIDAKDDDIVFATNSYLRPSNYTKNWRIKVDKSFNNHWNPVEDTYYSYKTNS